VEDDVLWGEGRENMVVGKRKRGEGRRTCGKVVAAPSAVGMTSSRGHGKNTKHKRTDFPRHSPGSC